MTRAARPRTSSAGSGFFLFGIIELPVENASATRDEPEPRVRPPGDLLGEPAEVDHPEGDRGEHLDHEIAIRDRVERVGRHAVEAELARRRLAIERVARPRQRAGPERRDVDPDARIGQAAPIALGHLDVRQQVMREQDRLGRLDVGRAGQDGGALAFRKADEGALEREQCEVEVVDRPTRPEAQVRRDLVVARTPGVELARPAARPSRTRAASTFMWTSSREGSQSSVPAAASRASAIRPSVRLATSSSVSSPARPSPRTCAIEPAMSSAARAASISIERVKSATRASVSPLNRPPQVRIVPPS